MRKASPSEAAGRIGRRPKIGRLDDSLNDMEALDAFRAVVGAEHLHFDASRTAAAETATFRTSSGVLAVIRPTDVTEVQACVRVANDFGVPIYPISAGRNWGLGSRVPASDGCVILDLGRLNRIVEHDDNLAFITVEPGVSFQQCWEYLRTQESELCLSVIGGPSSASMIGNVLERGDGIGPYGERLSHACGFEVVLPTGELIHTGFGRFSKSRGQKISSDAPGPLLDGVFTQSNLGIVTKMTVWLMRRPRHLQVLTCEVGDVSRLGKLIDAVRELMMEGVIQSNCFSLGNAYKFMSRMGRYPWKVTGGRTPLSLKKLTGREPWFGKGGLYAASREHGDADKKRIREVLVDHTDVLIFDEVDIRSNAGWFLGQPSDWNVRSTYRRKRDPIPDSMDPDKDRCGVIWLCPLLPADGAQIVSAIARIESTIRSRGFEHNVGILFTSPRCAHMFVDLDYDREVEGEDRRAMDCHDELLRLLMNDGHYPYRLGLQSMNSLDPAEISYGRLIRSLKQTFDPRDILAPGRYDFRNEWTEKS